MNSRRVFHRSFWKNLTSFFLCGSLLLASGLVVGAHAKSKTSVPSVSAMLKRYSQQLSNVSQLFLEARRHRRLNDAQLHKQLTQYIHEVQKQTQTWGAVLSKKKPAVYKQLQWWLLQMNGLMYRLKKKQSPKSGQFTPEQGLYRFLKASGSATLTTSNHPALVSWKATHTSLNATLLVERQVGQYRVGLRLRAPEPMYYWYSPGARRSDRRLSIRPPRAASAMLEVVVRHKDTAQFVYGTDVSMELLGVKNKQLSTARLTQLWRGFPVFSGYLIRPKKALKAIQISISPSPLTRTMKAIHLAQVGTVIQFPVLQKNGRFVFVKPAPPKFKVLKGKKVQVGTSQLVTPPVASGRHILKGLQLLGGRVKEAGDYRVGIGFLPPQKWYKWTGRGLSGRTPRYFRNVQIVVFVQDRNTGALIPGVRPKLLMYWNRKGETIREDIDLQPVHGAFPSYRKHVRLGNKHSFKVKLQLYPSLTARMQARRPHAYNFVWDGVKLPSEIKAPARIIRKKRKTRKRK